MMLHLNQMTDKHNQGPTSTDMAAWLISGGQTTDLPLANIYDSASNATFNLDELSRAHLRRMMGFDFQVKIETDRLVISSTQPPYVTTRTKVLPGELDTDGSIISEALISRLVEACMRLKRKYDKAQ